MTTKVIQPRCPHCGKCQADWVVEAKFTCRFCKTEFIIGDGYVTILTKSENRASVKIKV